MASRLRERVVDPVIEPSDRKDLGQTDRNIGLPDWSDSFVSTALHQRLTWLNTQRANHCAADEPVHGSWLLTASDGPTFLVHGRDRSANGARRTER
jgi:hypothetical protein